MSGSSPTPRSDTDITSRSTVGSVSRPSSRLTVAEVGICTEPAISNLKPSKSSTVEAIPPAYSLESRHSVRSPAFWSSAAAVSPLWPAPTTIASKSAIG